MPSVCLYLKLHRPYSLRSLLGDTDADRIAIDQLADDCCLATNEFIYDQLISQRGKFRISFSISGTMLELFQQYRPDVIDSFKKLVSTGCVELLTETYYHSLSSLYSSMEFQRQVIKHAETVDRLFGVKPVVFTNTALIHNNRIARLVGDLGIKAILCEGVTRVLQGRSCNRVYAVPDNYDVVLLLRNNNDDLSNAEVINLFIDYENFPGYKMPDNCIFLTPSEVIGQQSPKDIYNASSTISREDRSNTNCVWCENMMQNNSLKKIYSLEKLVAHAGGSERNTWGRLQSAEYFYYMDENADKHAHPYLTSKQAFQQYTSIVTDFEISLIKKSLQSKRSSYRELVSI